MIEQLKIKNFKSIRDLSISCKKLNVFIGESNSGKSNIVEALGLQSQNSIKSELNQDILRYKSLGDLFFDSNINIPIEVITNEKHSILLYATKENAAPLNEFYFILDNNSQQAEHPVILQHDGTVTYHGPQVFTNVHYYEYKRLKEFQRAYTPHLSVPHGENLPSLLLSNPELKKFVSDLFRSFGFRLMLKPTMGDMSMAKDITDELFEYPYFTISETLQRLIFYSIAIKSNNQNVLLFDEPESNMFPFYIKDFAERVAEDTSNQFFITTHNPYLLGSLLDKSEKDSLAVFIIQMKNYETIATCCNDAQIEELVSLGSGLFLSFDNILTPVDQD